MNSSYRLSAPGANPVRAADLELADFEPNSFDDYEDVRFELKALGNFETKKCRFLDVAFRAQEATEWLAAESNFRNVTLEIGRVGSFDLTASKLNVVTFENIRAGYLNLINSSIQDVLFKDCRFDTLDLFATKAKRIRFENCKVEDLDVRELQGEHIDLRGLDFNHVRGIASLRGATINEVQLMHLASDLALLAGINVA